MLLSVRKTWLALIGSVSLYWSLITMFLLIVITALSLLPLPELPKVPGSDKTQHLIAYAALMFPAFLARAQRRWLLMLAFVVWSGGLELIQPMVNRYGEWLDLLANSSGLLIGAMLGALFARLQNALLPNVGDGV